MYGIWNYSTRTWMHNGAMAVLIFDSKESAYEAFDNAMPLHCEVHEYNFHNSHHT